VAIEPQRGTFASGYDGILSVGISGSGPFSYQWQRNGSNLTGATGSNLNLGALQWSNAGLYSVIVSNGGGASTSSVAVVNVAPELAAQWAGNNLTLAWSGPYVLQTAGQVSGPCADIPKATSPFTLSTFNLQGQEYFRLRATPFGLTGEQWINGAFSVSGLGISGYNFVLEASTNLEIWQPLQTNPSPFNFLDTNAAAFPWRFYRAVTAH
jgi:hypothetical protein